MAKHLSFTIYKLYLNKASENGWVKYCCSVSQSCPTLCDPMDCSMPGFLVPHCLRSLLKLLSIESEMPSNHLILCRPLLLLPSVFPSIRVFSSELALRIKCLKYWSFSFSISPSKIENLKIKFMNFSLH